MTRNIFLAGIAALSLAASCKSAHDTHHTHDGVAVHEHDEAHAGIHDAHVHDHAHEHEHDYAHGNEDVHTHGQESAHGSSDEIVIPAEKAAAAGIMAETAELSSFSEIIHTSGEIRPATGHESTVAATTDGFVSFSGNYTEGVAVGPGTELFAIRSGNLQDGSRLEKNRIAYQVAKEEYERASKLTGSRIVSQKEYTRIKENYENARLAYEALSPSKTGQGVAVCATSSGYIKQISVREGDFVTAGTPLAIVEHGGTFILEADLSQKDFARRGDIVGANFKTAYDRMTYSTEELGGRLLSTGRSQNDGEYYIPVSFSIKDNGKFVPGAFAEIWLTCKDRENVLTLPLSAITEEQGLYFVYLKLDAECYRKQEVTLGADNGKRVEILSGISPGDNIVTSGAYNVKLASASNAIPAHTHSH